jgi:hypothetical protein
MMVHQVGIIALYLAARSAAPRASVSGLIASTAGLMLTCAIIGPFVYVYPVIGARQLSGSPDAVQIAIQAAGPAFLGSVMAEGLLVTVGAGLLGLALVRAGAMPKWNAVLFTLAPVLFSTPVPGLPAEVAGSAMLAASGVVLLRGETP